MDIIESFHMGNSFVAVIVATCEWTFRKANFSNYVMIWRSLDISLHACIQ